MFFFYCELSTTQKTCFEINHNDKKKKKTQHQFQISKKCYTITLT